MPIGTLQKRKLRWLIVVQSLIHNAYGMMHYNAMDCSVPGCPVLHHLLELAQTHVHWVGDGIQSSAICFSCRQYIKWLINVYNDTWAFSGVSVIKNLPANAGNAGSMVQEDYLNRKWLPAQVFLPGEFHRQKNPADYPTWVTSLDSVTKQKQQWYLLGIKFKVKHQWDIIFYIIELVRMF